jgi:ribosomal protein L6P/L9E
VIVEGEHVIVTIDNDDKKNLWGLTRTLVQNMITGTHE